MRQQFQRIRAVVQPGYQVASGKSDRSPYPAGTIAMQTPIFKTLGLDLTLFSGDFEFVDRALSFPTTHVPIHL